MFRRKACILIVMMLLVTGFSGCNDAKGKVTTDKTNATSTELKESTPDKASGSIDEKESLQPYPGELTSILLMGSMIGDFSDENYQNYALTHILLTLDPSDRTMRFTTFPYNMKLKPALEGKTSETQLQFLYAQYGADVVADTISQTFDVEIDGWVIMNMDGVRKIIDYIGGIEIAIVDLSVNNIAQNVESMLGYVWQEIKEEGIQLLNGIQISGYFMDTYHDLDDNEPTKDEEEKFRRKHKIIIDSLITTINASKIDEKQIVEIAQKVEDNFLTNIKKKDWNRIAKMAIACVENEQDFYNVPKVIEVIKDERMFSIAYHEEDVRDVSAFVSGE